MGILDESGKVKAAQTVESINKFFQGMLIRQIDIAEIKEKVRSLIASGQLTDIEGGKAFLNDEIYNSEYKQTSQALVGEAMQDAETNYNDQTLPLLSLLFLANSDQESFITTFKAVNLSKRGQNVGNDLKTANNGLSSANATGTVPQAANPSLIRKEDLKNLVNYHVNENLNKMVIS